MNSIASLFSKSAIRKAKLENLQEEFGCAILHMSQIHKIRWLSRQMVVKKVCDSYKTLLEFTKQDFFEKISTLEFMYNLHFLSDVLDRLATLSKVFQSTFVDVTSVVGFIELEMKALEMYFMLDPEVDVNASTHDRFNFHIILDYGPLDGQLYALRSSIRGVTHIGVFVFIGGLMDLIWMNA